MVLKLAILDANQKTTKDIETGTLSSVVGQWFKWEIENSGLSLSNPKEADVIFVVHSGVIQFVENVNGMLRHYGISSNVSSRGLSPYLITGGQIDVQPLTALRICNAVNIGEGYELVRLIMPYIKGGGDLKGLQQLVVDFPHAIEYTQTTSFSFDRDRPWLMTEEAPALATPSDLIDWWGVPLSISDDNVIRILTSKGCHGHCLFCATSWGQKYQYNPDWERLNRTIRQLSQRHMRYLLISNDPVALPYFTKLAGLTLDSESVTLRELMKPEIFEKISKSRVKIIRIGVEGVSERIRQAVGKPIKHADLVDALVKLNNVYGYDSHMFFIAGLPGETEDDWLELRDLYKALAKKITYRLIRAKFTSFVSTPPAPLMRFVTSSAYNDRFETFYSWIIHNAANRHFLTIKPQMPKSLSRAISAMLYADREFIFNQIMAGGVDMFPHISDLRRAPSELVGWKEPPELRWRAAETYKKRMGLAFKTGDGKTPEKPGAPAGDDKSAGKTG